MRICDLKQHQVKVGMRVRSLALDRVGTIVAIDRDDDNYSWIQWDGDSRPCSGFYGTDCECKIEWNYEYNT